MKDEEVNKCEFCGEIKSVSRYYIRIKNKHFDDNKKGKYSTYISYCNDCGIEPMLSSKHHSYLTDRIENRDKIRSIIAPLLIEELRRSGTMAKVAHAMLLSKMTDKLEAFLTESIQQSMEVGIGKVSAIANYLVSYVQHESTCILAQWEAGRPTKDGYEVKYNGKWYQASPIDNIPKCECGLHDLIKEVDELKSLSPKL